MLRLSADKRQSLKEFTENNYAQASFFWAYLLKNKEIKINGKKTNKDVMLNAGDEVCYFLTKKQEEKPAFYKTYEDASLLIIDKESGVNSEAVFSALQRENFEYRFIHRLDRNTQGLMVFAKNAIAEKELLTAFRDRRVEKVYHALCYGEFQQRQAILRAYLKKDDKNATVKIYDKPCANAEEIVTEYKVIEGNNNKTKIEVILHTGKTHQIRAHLAHISCPIVGDMKYGDTVRNRADNVARQCLISKYLQFNFVDNLTYINGKKFVSRFDL